LYKRITFWKLKYNRYQNFSANINLKYRLCHRLSIRSRENTCGYKEILKDPMYELRQRWTR